MVLMREKYPFQHPTGHSFNCPAIRTRSCTCWKARAELRSSAGDARHLLGADALGARKVRSWTLQSLKEQRAALELRPRLLVRDPQALCQSVLMGLGVALLAIPDVLDHLQSGALERVLGPISRYFAWQKLLPTKTRSS